MRQRIYLKGLVARIDVPLLGDLEIALFHQLIIDTLQLSQFISRTPALINKVQNQEQAHVYFSSSNVHVIFRWKVDRILGLDI